VQHLNRGSIRYGTVPNRYTRSFAATVVRLEATRAYCGRTLQCCDQLHTHTSGLENRGTFDLQCAAKVSTQIHADSPGDARMGLDRQSGGSYDGLLLTTHTAMQSIESHFGVPRFSFGLAADHQYGYSALDGECEKR